MKEGDTFLPQYALQMLFNIGESSGWFCEKM